MVRKLQMGAVEAEQTVLPELLGTHKNYDHS